MISQIAAKTGWKAIFFIQAAMFVYAVWRVLLFSTNTIPSNTVFGYVSSALLPAALYGLYLYSFNKPLPRLIQSKMLLRTLSLVLLFSNLGIVWTSVLELNASQLDAEIYSVICVLICFPSVYALWHLPSSASFERAVKSIGFAEIWGGATIILLHLTSIVCLAFVSNLLLMEVPYLVSLANLILFLGLLLCLVYQAVRKKYLPTDNVLLTSIMALLLISKGVAITFEFGAGGYQTQEMMFLCAIYLAPVFVLVFGIVRNKKI